MSVMMESEQPLHPVPFFEQELHLIDDTDGHPSQDEGMPTKADDDGNFDTMTLPCSPHSRQPSTNGCEPP